MPSPTPPLLDRFAAVVGETGLITAPDDMAPYLVDWRGRAHGRALAVLRPASTAEVAAVVKLCAHTRTPIVPQGGNTGQCAGAVPGEQGDAIVLALARLNRIREVDAANNTLTAEAGCILEHIQQAAAGVDRLFPLALGAQGSCQIGGNLSTNAGGTAVLRYGNAREMVLGLEVVLPDGEVWNGLKALRKDNTGYDLKQLFLGAEGTLGIITAAVLKLHPRPRVSATCLAAIESPQAGVALLNAFRDACGDRVTGFELISRSCLDLLFKHVPRNTDPLPERHAWYVLGELGDTLATTDLTGAMEATLARGIEQGWVRDAVVAASASQAGALWRMRDEIPEANRKEGPWVRHDISVPVSRVPELIERGSAALCARFPGVRIVAFGHIGDGNIHFNATAAPGEPPDALIAHQETVYAIMHDIVTDLNGSFSAEHGIGALKVGEVARYKAPIEIDLMRRIKRALDPHGLMNPGKVLPD